MHVPYWLQAHAKTVSEAQQLLQMTAVVPERAWRGESLSDDKELEGFLEHHMVFTDISMNKENNVRIKTVCFQLLTIINSETL